MNRRPHYGQAHFEANIFISLAYMELFMALGAIFRRFSFEIYETDFSDVELAHDFFLPSPKLDSKGIRVKVKEMDPDFRHP